MTSNLQSYAEDFANFSGIGLVKTAFIRKLPNGKYRVVSHKGKNLGTYDNREDAVVRLKQVEFFKHKKASEEGKNPEKLPNGEQVSYSSVMRFLNKNYEQDSVRSFQKSFKEHFDRLYAEGNEEPEIEALEEAMKGMEGLKKQANRIDLGPPDLAGQNLAAWVLFLLKRVPQPKRKHALENVKKKIYYINEYQIANRKPSQFASLGQAISIIKNVLLENPPQYIRQVINAIVKAL